MFIKKSSTTVQCYHSFILFNLAWSRCDQEFIRTVRSSVKYLDTVSTAFLGRINEIGMLNR